MSHVTFRAFALLAALSVLVAAVSGGVAAQSDADDLEDLLRSAVDAVNAAGGYEAPDYVAGTVVGPVNLVVHDGDATHTFSFVVAEDLTIAEFRAGERDDARTLMTTERAVLESIAADEDPAGALATAFADGDIRVEGIGFVESVKWAVINFLRSVLGVLGLSPV